MPVKRCEGEILQEIVRLCFTLDGHAHHAYLVLAGAAPNEELRSLWRKMAAEEFEHTRFWKRVLQHADQLKTLPRVFDQPAEILDELRQTLRKVEALLQNDCASLSVEEAFILAYRLEFYMLHPAFEILFNLLCFLVGSPCPGDDYEQHVSHFVAALTRHGHANPSLELLGETFDRLWKENRRLARQATRDSLTGCLNRQAFMEIALHLCVLARRKQETIGVMMIDLDHFKGINDNWGHQVGDQVLKASGQIIRSSLRGSDVLARYGGEEFIVLMPDIGHDVALQVANRVRESFAAQRMENIRPTLSAGVALGPVDGDVEACLFELIRQADLQLYRAKQTGRNRVVC